MKTCQTMRIEFLTVKARHTALTTEETATLAHLVADRDTARAAHEAALVAARKAGEWHPYVPYTA